MTDWSKFGLFDLIDLLREQNFVDRLVKQILIEITSFKYFLVSVNKYRKYAITFGFCGLRERLANRIDSFTRPRTIRTRSFG